MSTRPKLIEIEGCKYVTMSRASFCINEPLLTLYEKNGCAGILLYIRPKSKSSSKRGCYFFSSSEVAEHLMPKRSLECWKSKGEWSQSVPPKSLEKYFKPDVLENEDPGVFVSGADVEQRRMIREGLDAFVQRMMDQLSLPGEAIALEVRYWHQAGKNPYRTVATSTDKKSSWAYHEGQCKACDGSIEFSDAVFHHVRRGVSGQHSPGNLLPYHNKCHDFHHHKDNIQASMTKGRPVKKAG